MLEVRHRQALDRVAEKIVGMGLMIPALFLIESVRPLNFISSQLLHFLSPLVNGFGSFPDYDTVAEALEQREAVEYLLQRIEAQEEKW